MRPSKAVLGLLPVGLGLVLATPLASSYSHSSPDVSLALEAVHTTALTPETTHITQEDASDSLSGKTHVVVPCQGCLSDGGDAYLAFDLSSTSSFLPCGNSFLSVNNGPLLSSQSSHNVSLNLHASGHEVSVLVDAICTPPDFGSSFIPSLTLTVVGAGGKAVSEKSGFTLESSNDQDLLINIFQEIYEPGVHHHTTSDAHHSAPDLDSAQLLTKVEYDLTHASTPDEAATNLVAQVNYIRENYRQSQALLYKDLESCQSSLRHRVVCSAKVLCQQTCDAFNRLLFRLKTTLGDSATKSVHNGIQTAMSGLRAYKQCSNETLPLVGDFKDKQIDVTVTPVQEAADSPNPLVRVLEILAGAFGLTALFAYIRRRCWSLRRKVERLADREERRTAQQYRRAARREAVRRRWRSVKGAFCGLGSNGDYEEKRALILEEAGILLANDEGPSQHAAEMAQDELTGLRYAHEIVAAMIRAEQRTSNYTPPTSGVVQDTLFAAADARSRSSTLPSYKSETLPEYSSTTGSDDERVADGFRHYQASVLSSPATMATTPDSSVPDLSPRCSGETLRTRHSQG